MSPTTTGKLNPVNFRLRLPSQPLTCLPFGADDTVSRYHNPSGTSLYALTHTALRTATKMKWSKKNIFKPGYCPGHWVTQGDMWQRQLKPRCALDRDWWHSGLASSLKVSTQVAPPPPLHLIQAVVDSVVSPITAQSRAAQLAVSFITGWRPV